MFLDGFVTIPRGGVFGDFRKKRRAAGCVKKSRMFEGIARVRDFSSPPPGARKSPFSAGTGICYEFIFLKTHANNGFGLIAAIFAIVFLGLFGLLAAKHLQSTANGSGEAYIWAQTLYTAESTARLKILDHDGGGTGFTAPTIQGINGSIASDTFGGAGIPSALEAHGISGKIIRKIQVKYIL